MELTRLPQGTAPAANSPYFLLPARLPACVQFFLTLGSIVLGAYVAVKVFGIDVPGVTSSGPGAGSSGGVRPSEWGRDGGAERGGCHALLLASLPARMHPLAPPPLQQPAHVPGPLS